MEFGQLGEFYRDESGFVLGPDVKVTRTLMNGDKVVEYMPVAIAVCDVLFDDLRNGVDFKSAKIDFGNLLDVWGGSV